MNLFLSLLTGPAPTSNYRGESEQNRSILQKLVIGDDEYPVISPEAIRNGLREMLIDYGLPSNRRREKNEDQPAVSFADYPNPDKYVDDFLFGYMVVNRDQIPKALRDTFVYKRDSLIRNNLAIGLKPYIRETLFTQSPKTVNRNDPEKSPDWSNATSSQLLHREVMVTAFQLPIALNLGDFKSEQGRNWLAHLLRAISELSHVGGNHTRSYFEMAPVSLVARLTPRLASGYPLYPFQPDGGVQPIVRAILTGKLPAEGFYFGGELLDAIGKTERTKLRDKGAEFHVSPEALVAELCKKLCGQTLPLETR